MVGMGGRLSWSRCWLWLVDVGNSHGRDICNFLSCWSISNKYSWTLLR
jgi:hypothetical protein